MTPLFTQVFLIIFAIISIALVIWNFVLEHRIKKLCAGKGAMSLEETIARLGDDVRMLEKFQSDTNNYLSEADKRIKRSIQRVETIRFNAFKGIGEGGNQSFAIAFLSENGDGTVVSSLFTRDRMNVYAKPVKSFSSEFEMTEEEKDAIKRAARQ